MKLEDAQAKLSEISLAIINCENMHHWNKINDQFSQLKRVAIDEDKLEESFYFDLENTQDLLNDSFAPNESFILEGNEDEMVVGKNFLDELEDNPDELEGNPVRAATIVSPTPENHTHIGTSFLRSTLGWATLAFFPNHIVNQVTWILWGIFTRKAAKSIAYDMQDAHVEVVNAEQDETIVNNREVDNQQEVIAQEDIIPHNIIEENFQNEHEGFNYQCELIRLQLVQKQQEIAHKQEMHSPKLDELKQEIKALGKWLKKLEDNSPLRKGIEELTAEVRQFVSTTKEKGLPPFLIENFDQDCGIYINRALKIRQKLERPEEEINKLKVYLKQKIETYTQQIRSFETVLEKRPVESQSEDALINILNDCVVNLNALEASSSDPDSIINQSKGLIDIFEKNKQALLDKLYQEDMTNLLNQLKETYHYEESVQKLAPYVSLNLDETNLYKSEIEDCKNKLQDLNASITSYLQRTLGLKALTAHFENFDSFIQQALVTQESADYLYQDFFNYINDLINEKQNDEEVMPAFMEAEKTYFDKGFEENLNELTQTARNLSNKKAVLKQELEFFRASFESFKDDVTKVTLRKEICQHIETYNRCKVIYDNLPATYENIFQSEMKEAIDEQVKTIHYHLETLKNSLKSFLPQSRHQQLADGLFTFSEQESLKLEILSAEVINEGAPSLEDFLALEKSAKDESRSFNTAHQTLEDTNKRYTIFQKLKNSLLGIEAFKERNPELYTQLDTLLMQINTSEDTLEVSLRFELICPSFKAFSHYKIIPTVIDNDKYQRKNDASDKYQSFFWFAKGNEAELKQFFPNNELYKAVIDEYNKSLKFFYELSIAHLQLIANSRQSSDEEYKQVYDHFVETVYDNKQKMERLLQYSPIVKSVNNLLKEKNNHLINASNIKLQQLINQWNDLNSLTAFNYPGINSNEAQQEQDDIIQQINTELAHRTSMKKSDSIIMGVEETIKKIDAKLGALVQAKIDSRSSAGMDNHVAILETKEQLQTNLTRYLDHSISRGEFLINNRSLLKEIPADVSNLLNEQQGIVGSLLYSSTATMFQIQKLQSEIEKACTDELELKF